VLAGGGGLVRLRKIRARLAQRFAFEIRPSFDFIRTRLERDLRGRFAAEDSETKTAVVVRGAEWLARTLGLEKTRLLVLDYPDFSLDNLALLSGEYHFVISDRALHRCDNLEDAGHETMRVLATGGRFVHTTGALDVSSISPISWRRAVPSALARLFPNADSVASGGGALASWVTGRKVQINDEMIPTAAARVAKRRWYRFRPQSARFGVCAIVRNEAPYLLEWIAHYRVLGFERIVIYDNQSNDSSARILGALSEARIVDAVYWRDRDERQVRAYNDAARRLRPFVEWCLFADLDEFLVLDDGLTLEDLLPKDPAIAAVGIPWRIFGSDGQRNRGTELVIERFTKAAPTFHRLVKSLIRLRDVEAMGIHVPKRIRGRTTDLYGQPLDLLKPRTAPSAARMYHYFNRSWEEFLSKRLRGDIERRDETYGVSDFDRYGAGEVEVRDALSLAPLVRHEIARLRRILGRD